MENLHYTFAGILFVWALITVVFTQRSLRAEGTKSPIINYPNRDASELLNIFEKRYNAYLEEKKRLERLIIIQASLIGITASQIFQPTKIATFNLFNINLPIVAFSLMVPFMLLYVWGRFGITLDTLIDTRLSLNVLLKKLDDPKIGADSLRPTLRDNGVVDSYLAYYSPENLDRPEKEPQWLSKLYMPFFGVFFSAAHSSIFCILWKQIERWSDWRSYYFGIILFVFFGFFITITHYHFGFRRGSGSTSTAIVILTFIISIIFILVPKLLRS
ncbi:MAG: hypothetical protein JW814_10430 [Candidatus Krumholzibacteriota bacterium]|nr:hypothetical protein [Candidatus Krumholzibacteriota bacterium]